MAHTTSLQLYTGQLGPAKLLCVGQVTLPPLHVRSEGPEDADRFRPMRRPHGGAHAPERVREPLQSEGRLTAAFLTVTNYG